MFANRKETFILFLLTLIVLVVAPVAQADIKPGVRAGTYFDPNKAAIGAEVLVNLNDEQTWFFNPNFEYVFLDRSDLWTFNFDVHYDLLPGHYPVYWWVGGGPAILLRDPDNDSLNSDTDFGMNIFTGVGFKIRGTSLVPYIQPKYTISDNDRFSVAFGLRF